MSRSSLILGFIVSIIAHVVLFVLLSGASQQQVAQEEAKPDRVTIDPSLFAHREEIREENNSLDEEDDPETEPKSDPEPEPEPVKHADDNTTELIEVEQEQVDETTPDADVQEALADSEPDEVSENAPIFEQVIDPEMIDFVENGELGDVHREIETEGDRVPMLRISWSGADEVREVARSLGMRIVAVTRDHDIVGEVRLTGSTEIDSFDADLAAFSNRVRSFPATFFGREILDQSPHRIAAYWLLVPVHVDRELIRIQHSALEKQGLRVDHVRRMEATFERRGEKPTLIITNIHSRS